MIFSTHRNTRFYLLMIGVLLAGIAYLLPWLIGRGVGLTFGAYDLAEWASLHPQVRAQSPTLLTSLLLRMPPVCLAFVVAFSVPTPPFRSRWWWAGAAFALIVTIALIPPLEFFIHIRDDINHRQQFIIAVTAFAGSTLGLSGLVPGVRRYAAIFMALAGIGVSLVGLQQSYTLMRDFNLPVQIGVGAIGTVLIFVWITLNMLRNDNRVTS